MLSGHRHEFKSYHEEWINSSKPILDPVISAQIQASCDANTDYCRLARDETRSALNSLLKVLIKSVQFYG